MRGVVYTEGREADERIVFETWNLRVHKPFCQMFTRVPVLQIFFFFESCVINVRVAQQTELVFFSSLDLIHLHICILQKWRKILLQDKRATQAVFQLAMLKHFPQKLIFGALFAGFWVHLSRSFESRHLLKIYTLI